MEVNKKDLIRLLETIAVYMELKGENPFKVSAFRKAASALEFDDRSLSEIEDFTTISGIGKGTAAVVLRRASTRGPHQRAQARDAVRGCESAGDERPERGSQLVGIECGLPWWHAAVRHRELPSRHPLALGVGHLCRAGTHRRQRHRGNAHRRERRTPDASAAQIRMYRDQPLARYCTTSSLTLATPFPTIPSASAAE
jgi:hypothetical protein